MNYEKLISIKEKIEAMSIYHQQEILEILKKFQDVFLNENNNGVFVNLSEVNDDVVNKLEEYINYVNTQQKYIDKIEKQKHTIEKIFFTDNIIESNQLLDSDVIIESN